MPLSPQQRSSKGVVDAPYTPGGHAVGAYVPLSLRRSSSPSPPRTSIDSKLKRGTDSAAHLANSVGHRVELATRKVSLAVDDAAHAAVHAVDDAAHAAVHAVHFKDLSDAIDSGVAAILPSYAGAKQDPPTRNEPSIYDVKSRKAKLASAMEAGLLGSVGGAASLQQRANLARRPTMKTEIGADGQPVQKLATTSYIVTHERDKLAEKKGTTDAHGIAKLKRASDDTHVHVLHAPTTRLCPTLLCPATRWHPALPPHVEPPPCFSSASHAPPPRTAAATTHRHHRRHHSAQTSNLAAHQHEHQSFAARHSTAIDSDDSYHQFSEEDVARVLPVLREVRRCCCSTL